MATNTLNQTLYNSLKELGLSELEINLYTVSLSLGPVPIKKIAESMGISRPNVYKVIKNLESHGLVQFSDRAKYTRTFMVESPTTIIDKLRQKKEKISVLDNDFIYQLPDLLAQYHQGETPTKIKVMKGRDQYIKVFNQSLEEAKDEIQYFGSADDFINFISWGNELNWMRKRIKKGIFMKILVFREQISNDLKGKDVVERRETRFLKEVDHFHSSFMLFSNKVIIFQPKAPLAIFIEDQFIVEMLKGIFNKMWGISE